MEASADLFHVKAGSLFGGQFAADAVNVVLFDGRGIEKRFPHHAEVAERMVRRNTALVHLKNLYSAPVKGTFCHGLEHQPRSAAAGERNRSLAPVLSRFFQQIEN